MKKVPTGAAVYSLFFSTPSCLRGSPHKTQISLSTRLYKNYQPALAVNIQRAEFIASKITPAINKPSTKPQIQTNKQQVDQSALYTEKKNTY